MFAKPAFQDYYGDGIKGFVSTRFEESITESASAASSEDSAPQVLASLLESAAVADDLGGAKPNVLRLTVRLPAVSPRVALRLPGVTPTRTVLRLR